MYTKPSCRPTRLPRAQIQGTQYIIVHFEATLGCLLSLTVAIDSTMRPLH